MYRQTDALPYDLTVRAVTPGNAGAFVAAPPSAASPPAGALKCYGPHDALPEKPDCFVQVWEIDDWIPNDTSQRFDQWHTFEDRTSDGKPGKNHLIGHLGGFLVRTADKRNPVTFVCTDASGLKEPGKNESFFLLNYKTGKGAGDVSQRKVGMKIEDETRWEIGVVLSAKADDKKWESTQFTYPICAIQCLRNLIKMQLAIRPGAGKIVPWAGAA